MNACRVHDIIVLLLPVPAVASSCGAKWGMLHPKDPRSKIIWLLMCPCSAILASTNPAPQHDSSTDDLGCASHYHRRAHELRPAELRPADLNRCGPRAAVLAVIGYEPSIGGGFSKIQGT